MYIADHCRSVVAAFWVAANPRFTNQLPICPTLPSPGQSSHTCREAPIELQRFENSAEWNVWIFFLLWTHKKYDRFNSDHTNPNWVYIITLFTVYRQFPNEQIGWCMVGLRHWQSSIIIECDWLNHCYISNHRNHIHPRPVFLQEASSLTMVFSMLYSGNFGVGGCLIVAARGVPKLTWSWPYFSDDMGWSAEESRGDPLFELVTRMVRAPYPCIQGRRNQQPWHHRTTRAQLVQVSWSMPYCYLLRSSAIYFYWYFLHLLDTPIHHLPLLPSLAFSFGEVLRHHLRCNPGFTFLTSDEIC